MNTESPPAPVSSSQAEQGDSSEHTDYERRRLAFTKSTPATNMSPRAPSESEAPVVAKEIRGELLCALMWLEAVSEVCGSD